MGMGVRVEVEEGEVIRSAMRRLQKKMAPLKRRRFYKCSRDYYEKPCELRRRAEYEALRKKGCRRPKT
jgi:ribosomal protein S21